MEQEFVKKVKVLFALNKEIVITENTGWHNSEDIDKSKILKYIVNFFNEAECKIKEEHEKSFVTDEYENKVRRFAVKISKLLILNYDILKDDENYKQLLEQRHIAYGFFKGYENNYFNIDYNEFTYKTNLYLGLVYFYENFYGNFYDNEEAIVFLCKYYMESVYQKNHIESIVSALHKHISMAGTPSDIGYAYKGIELIQKYINNIPVIIIKDLLNQYELYYIVNQKIVRNQIFSIIKYSKIGTEEKKLYKFWYLDSLIIVNRLNLYLYEKLKEGSSEVDGYMNIYGNKLIDEKIIVFNKPSSHWSNNNINNKREFFMFQKKLMKITLKSTEIEVEYSGKIEKFNFEENDWVLDKYNLKENKDLLKALINSRTEFKLGYDDNMMTFSLLYMENYRGLKKQLINFDHKFHYDKINNELLQKSENSKKITHFYGESIYSLTCIVGKNGSGKTSIVDFLRETFFKLLKLIIEFDIHCENGYINEEEYFDYGILDKDAKFVVLFNIGKTTYFLTNINEVNSSVVDLKPFKKDIYDNYSNFSKVFYFSNMLRSDQENVFVENEKAAIYNDDEKRNKENISKVLNGFRQVDYSEIESFIRKRKSIEIYNNLQTEEDNNLTIINKEICYQISLLKNIHPDKLKEYFDIDRNKEFLIKSTLLKSEEKFTIQELESGQKNIENIEKIFLKAPDSKLKHFSSGQYAKFTFFAKLYWLLYGYTKEINRYIKIVGNNVFSNEEILMNDETALIFIDEGELYYHPEWQRRYIKTLLEIINRENYKAKIQIVITTNSPFILSDILKDDVTYLVKDNRNEEFGYTLGQNIHTLLKKNFFMDYTIGEYSRELINKIMICLKEENGKNDTDRGTQIDESIKSACEYYFNVDEKDNYYDLIYLLINQIGEPIYRLQLMKELEKSKIFERQKYIRELEAEKIILEEKIKKLKEDAEY